MWSYAVSWSSVRRCYLPRRGDAGWLHLWPTWFDFVKCVPFPPPRPGQLLISPPSLFIMSEPLNKRERMQEVSVWRTGAGWRCRAGRGGGGCVNGPNRVYQESKTALCLREMALSSSARVWKSGVTFLVSSLPLIRCHFVLSARACSYQIPGQFGWDITESVYIKLSYIWSSKWSEATAHETDVCEL